MWKIYDDLIDAIPDNLFISQCLAGQSWFLVRSEGLGVAMAPRECKGDFSLAGSMAGRRVRDVACWIKSWNLNEAAIGLAAINSALNGPAGVTRNCGNALDDSVDVDVFAYLKEQLRGKRVAVIGHFHNLENLAPICELSILERFPLAGDYPDPACEYILPKQDFVIMTATTLINKTMPRLLELSRDAKVAIAGPSTPLHPLMFRHGVDLLGGLVVEDEEKVWTVVQEGGRHSLFTSGSRMVKVSCEAMRTQSFEPSLF